MKRTLLFVLALAVTPVGVDAQVPYLEVMRTRAEQGHAFSQSFLGDIYASGDGVPQDYEEAVRWYRLAADQGYASAYFGLGSMYYDGRGVPEDHEEAVRWYRLAAEQGNLGSQRLLGVMYRDGEGVPVDYVLSYMWFNLAAAQGGSDAQRTKDIINEILAPQMTSEQIAEGQRLTREWLEAHPPGS